MLSSMVGMLGKMLSPRGMRWVNRISGIIILGFGILALLTLA
jgi:threonine/homoserine/homoserine lactone efflux protein